MLQLLPYVVSLGLIFAAATAQQQPAAELRDASEVPFLQGAAKELNAFATLAFKNRFPARARDLWREIVAEYDADDAVAREQLGFVRVGTAWQPKPGFSYPTDDEPDAQNAKTLESRWAALGKKLADGHRGLADQLATAGKQARAEYHYERALRFVPADTKAQTALGAHNVEGLTGTDLELELLRRTRLIERLITKLSDESFPVQPKDVKDPRLDKANVSYTAVASEHFTVLGDWEPEVLTATAVWAERSLAFCKEAFEGEAWAKAPTVTPRFAFFKQRSTWADVVRANEAAIGGIDFVLQNTSAITVSTGPEGWHLAGCEAPETVFDFTVRKVAQDWGRVASVGMREGVGHAVVGLFFGKNLINTVGEQKKEGTAASRDYSRFEMPDLEVWKDLARDIAFERATAPAAHLPLVQAAKFTHEERIKSWSFCDYLLRRDPMLMVHLDETRGKARNDLEVIDAFLASTKLALPDVEADWRRFYTGDSAALAAIRGRVTPMQAVSKDAPIWLEELNRLRRLYEAPAVGWSSELSVACRMHADYLKQNKGERGDGKEYTQTPGKPGFSNVGRLFAENALISTKEKDPRKAMESWLFLPGHRDVLLDRGLKLVGAYADGPILVMDVLRGRQNSRRSDSLYFPYSNQKGDRYRDPLPAAVSLDLLGPEVRTLLQEHLQPKQQEIGFPLTMHFFAADTLATVSVSIDGTEVPGLLVHAVAGTRRTAAPGMWVFYPYQPLPKGKDILLLWTVKKDTHKVIFTTS